MPATLSKIVIALAAALSNPVFADVPPRSLSGATLVVPPEHASLGKVYHVRYPSQSGQITFASDAPIEMIVGTSSRVVGYVVAELRDDAPTGRLLAGGFRLPVRSLDTGIALRNEHMQQPQFFDAGQFPDIAFEITGSEPSRVIESTDDATTHAVTLHGAMTIKGVTETLDVPARLTYMPGSIETRNAGPGDVLALRCVYTVLRSDYGVASQFVNAELSDTIEITQRIILTTVSFDERLQATDDPERSMRMQRVVSLIGDQQELDAAAALADELIDECWDDAPALNTLAWNLATTEGTNARRFPRLIAAAERASDLAGGENADVLDTVARAYHELGDLGNALAWQRRAVEHRESSGDPVALVATLHEYERDAGLPPTAVQAIVTEDRPQGAEFVRTYVGTYAIEARGVELVCVDLDGRLHLRPPQSEGTIELLYQGDHAFRLADQPQVEITFEVENGRAQRIELRGGPAAMRGERVEPEG